MDACVHATSKPCPHGKPHGPPGLCRVAGAGTFLRERWDAGEHLSWGAEGAAGAGGCRGLGWPRYPTMQGFSQPHGPSVGHSHPRSSLTGAVPKQGSARQRKG